MQHGVQRVADTTGEARQQQVEFKYAVLAGTVV
jgi:hypothetical protein